MNIGYKCDAESETNVEIQTELYENLSLTIIQINQALVSIPKTNTRSLTG